MSDIKIVTSWDAIPPVMYDGPDGEACSMRVLEKSYRDMENQLASGIHTCTDTCQRPLCVLHRQMKELEDLQLTIYNAGYEKGNFDAVEGHYAPPIEYPEEFPEILEELEGE